MAIVMFVNHLEHNCGVYQFFHRLTKPVLTSQLFECYYIETNHEWEFNHWTEQLNPDIIVYNFYFSGATMPWLTSSTIARNKHRKQIALHHEGNILDKGFDLVLHQDPFNTDTRYFNLSRPIPEYYPYIQAGSIIPAIGTFGFGLGGKGFTRLVEQVASEFDDAHVYVNIPFAHFGDADGNGARWWANASREVLNRANKPGIQLTITHDMLPEADLLNFLAFNTINCFLYDGNLGRGLSGTTDYALAVNRPIAITRSDQFKHLWSMNEDMLIENHSLKEIIAMGTKPLEPFHQLWNTQQLIHDFETAFYKVLE